MSKSSGSALAASAARDRLARLLDRSDLADLVPQLTAETLQTVIHARGLDACSALVACATPEQLAAVLDLDLWRGAPAGHDDRFDAARFSDWLALLADMDDADAARIVATMDVDLLVGGLSQHVRVFDLASFAPIAPSDDEPWDRRPKTSNAAEREIAGYVLRAAQSDVLDAIAAVLTALETHQPERFRDVIRGCRRLSSRGFERDGLDDLLSAADQRLHDLSIARDGRRSTHGYLSTADARAFLAMARTPRRPRAEAADGNPIAAAYRQVAEAAAAAEEARPQTRGARATADPGVEANVRAIEDVAIDITFGSGRPRGLLTGDAAAPSRLAVIQRLMAHLQHTHAPVYDERARELAFLTNALMSGCALPSGPFTAERASAAAVSTCNLGLEHWPDRWPLPVSGRADVTAIPDDFLARHDLVAAFEVGWSILHDEVSLAVVDRLLATIEALRCTDRDTLLALHALARQMRAHRDTPWLASDALDVIAILDMPAWTSLLGLVGECPVMPDVLSATVEGRTGAIDAKAFDFIATKGQLDVIRTFLARLPDLLSG
jgi:hypothetical protein